MDKRKRNITALGILTVLTTVVFFWGMNFLLGSQPWSRGTDLVLRLPDGAGLNRSDRVFLSGVDVGLVQSVDIEPGGGVVVGIRVRKNLLLPSDTRAAVLGDVFGAHTVELQPGTSVLRLENGDTIEGRAVPQLTQLAVDLGTQVRAVLNSADSLLSPGALRDVHQTAAVLPGSAVELQAALAQFRLAADALRRTTEEVAEARTGEAIAGALGEVERSAQALTSAASSMERSLSSLSSVFAKIDEGHGTLGRLVNDSSLYLEFSNTLREMRMLAGDIRERPGRYINLRIF